MFLLEVFTLIAVFVFAISASLSAIKKKFDLFGIAFIAFVTSVGGGTVRDIMLGNYPISWLQESRYAVAILIGVLFSILFTKRLAKVRKTFFWFDTIGIGVSAIIGVEKGLMAGLDHFICIFFGVITGIFGGIIRDTLTNQVPMIFRKEIYATTLIVGGLVYIALLDLGASKNLAMPLTIALTILIRFLSIKYKIQLPTLEHEIRNTRKRKKA